MHKFTLVMSLLILVFPAAVQAKKFKPKYYESCYAGFEEMRELVPEPPVDVQKTAKTVSAVAGIAGRFGGFGGLGSAVSTASTVAKYSDTIADVAAFTSNMASSFPDASDRYRAYGERIGTEAGEMDKVADFAMASQDCYATAYTQLRQASVSGEMKSKEVRKRQDEITDGVAAVSEMLEHAAIYMDTNITAYNDALTQETTGAGIDLGQILSLAAQAQSVTSNVQALTPGSGDGWMGTTWTESEVRIESHRQAMAAHYAAAGIPNPNPAPAVSSGNLLGGFGSLTRVASLGSINSGLGAHMALEQAVGQANLASAGYSDAQPAQAPVSAPSMSVDDPRVAALMDAGTDVEPYLKSYNRVKALSGMQQGIAGFVNTKL